MGLATAHVVIDAGASDRLRDEAARALKRELDQVPQTLTVLASEPDNTPSGAKTGIALVVGTLSVTVPSAAVLRTVGQIVMKWLERSQARTVSITVADRTVTLNAANARDQHTAIEALVEAARTREDGECPGVKG